ncbi:MAG TPA: nicotinate-nucleotide--dimethylbenzimidazole phosphoribosyltransferase [Firmicutes bacterium]|nr:nicotinate-nucleotide--dimethylbenzimidazole phosphoribosyltransferase [Bacillota bacterium]
MNFRQGIEKITGLDAAAVEAARNYQHALAKPAGSLGTLEEISIQIAGITGKVKNTAEKKMHYLFGADNGVYAEGVAATPQDFTRKLLCHYAAGIGCGINVLCENHQVELRLVDMGVIGGPISGTKNCRLMENGTFNFRIREAIPPDIVEKAIQIGFDCAAQAKQDGCNLLGNGEVGMANTTTAAACIMAALEIKDPELAVGRGAGLTDEAFARKKLVIADGLRLHHPDPKNPADILSKVGGLDIAAMCGLYLGAAYYRIPIVIDGLISIAAALLAVIFCPAARDFMIASHISAEPGYRIASEALKLTPALCLGMRLGEGSGCPVMMGIIDDALAVINRMSTFAEAELETGYRSSLQMH